MGRGIKGSLLTVAGRLHFTARREAIGKVRGKISGSSLRKGPWARRGCTVRGTAAHGRPDPPRGSLFGSSNCVYTGFGVSTEVAYLNMCHRTVSHEMLRLETLDLP